MACLQAVQPHAAEPSSAAVAGHAATPIAAPVTLHYSMGPDEQLLQELDLTKAKAALTRVCPGPPD